MVSGTVHGPKKQLIISLMLNFHFSFESHNKQVKYRFLSCLTQRKNGKRVSEKQLESGEKKSKTANSNFYFLY